MRLHFLKRDVQKLLEHTKNSEEHVGIYGDESTERPRLMMIGDEGVYLMSNGKPGLFREEAFEKATLDSPTFVVYAVECNFLTLPFEEWHRTKEESFGSDNGIHFLGIDFIEAALLRPGKYIELEITEEGIDAFY